MPRCIASGSTLLQILEQIHSHCNQLEHLHSLHSVVGKFALIIFTGDLSNPSMHNHLNMMEGFRYTDDSRLCCQGPKYPW